MTTQFKDPRGRRPLIGTDASIAAFEAFVTANGWSTARWVVNGKLHHYMDPDVDNMWIGYQQGARDGSRMKGGRSWRDRVEELLRHTTAQLEEIRRGRV